MGHLTSLFFDSARPVKGESISGRAPMEMRFRILGETMNIRTRRLSGYIPALFAATILSSLVCSTPASAQFVASTLAPADPVPLLVTMFTGTLDTKDAKVGDAITLKVKKNYKLKDLKIPSGSTVIGTVQSVQSMKDGDGTSALGIEFQKVVLKDNKELPIRGLIMAVGKVGIAHGVGYMDILGRGGVGSTSGVDPSLTAGKGPVDNIPLGSSMPGVALSKQLDANQATQMRGVKTDIQFDSATMIKIQLFRATPVNAPAK